jgi:hypothetical protein
VSTAVGVAVGGSGRLTATVSPNTQETHVDEVGAATGTYTALANRDVYLLLTDQFGWTAEHYRTWLVDTTTRLLLTDDNPKGAPAWAKRRPR